MSAARMGDQPIWLGPWELVASEPVGSRDNRGFISAWPGDYWCRPFLHGGVERTRWLRLYPLPSERPLVAQRP